jgi:hypothetical protein
VARVAEVLLGVFVVDLVVGVLEGVAAAGRLGAGLKLPSASTAISCSGTPLASALSRSAIRWRLTSAWWVSGLGQPRSSSSSAR